MSAAVPPPSNDDVKTPPAPVIPLEELRPFGGDVCEDWRQSVTSAPLHERALEELYTLGVEGRIIMLSAPRAGHGKTHLVGRVAEKLTGKALMLDLPWQSEEGLTWMETGRGILADLASGHEENQPQALQQLGAGVNTILLRRLIQTGRIPSTDPAQALRVLSEDPMDLFSEGGQARIIGDWFRRHAYQLRGQLAEISNVEGTEEVEAWLKGLFDYIEHPTPARLEGLVAQLESDPEGQLIRLLKLATAWKPVVLVADHMDALYRDVEAGIAITRMALALTAVPGVHVVLSMNQDLWDATFGKQLPSALEDRLSARHVALSGLSLEDANALVTLRLSESGAGKEDQGRFLKFLNLEPYVTGRPYGSVSVRNLLRHAGEMWKNWLRVKDLPSALFKEGDSTGKGTTEDTEPLPMMPDESEEDLTELAQKLAEDAGGKVVDVANHTETAEISPVALVPPAGSGPPPLPVNTDDGGEDGDTPNFKPAPPTAEALGANYHKLRQILAKLSVPGNPEETAAAVAAIPPKGLEAASLNGTNGTSTTEETDDEPAPPLLPDDDEEEDENSLPLLYRRLRNESLRGENALQVDQSGLGHLLKLAGKRFPVVNYDEVELPGLLGRSLPRWSLQGMELVFGLADFTDTRYWKTVSSFVAGRLEELQAGSKQTGEPGPHMKLVVFKGKQEDGPLLSLLEQDVIPSTLRACMDVVHLDSRSLASLAAMRQIIQEAETGQLKSEPIAVLGALANELDFFWKRITRPKAA